MPSEPLKPPTGVDAGLHERLAVEIEALKTRLAEIDASRGVRLRADDAAPDPDTASDEPPGILE